MGFDFRDSCRQWLRRSRTQEVLTNSDNNTTTDSNMQEKSSIPKEGGSQEVHTNSDDDTTLGSNSEEKSQVPNAPTVPDVPKEGGIQGWLNVSAVFMFSACTWGVNGSFGVYKARYIDKNVYSGGTPLMYAFIAGLAICSITIFAPFVTILNRTCGTRASLVMGVFIQCAGLLGASWAKEIWTLFLCQGLLFGAGSCCLYVSSYGIIPQWFDKKRSLAVSLGSSGGGIGGLAWSLAAARMIESPLGFGWSFRITAIVAVAINLVFAMLIKDRNHLIKTRQRAFDYRLLRRYELKLLLLWGFFSMLAYTIVLFSMADYAKHIHMSNDQAAIVTALVNLGMGVGRPLIGLGSDKFGRFNVACTASILGGLFSLCLWTAAGKDAHHWVYSFAFLGGITITGTFWAVIGPLTAEVTSLEILPDALSIIWFAMAFPSLGAPAIALRLEAHPVSRYLEVKIFCGVVELVGASFLILLRGRMLSLAANRQKNTESTSKAADKSYRERPWMTKAWTDVKNMLPWCFWKTSSFKKI